ncbi:unnamed protein product [Cylindrotheca closterium]|uniref:EF-hand domain-containing protein n=1 Tax=Cylindrotheca closterium TaxID=2856 RepID=A0AAD2FSM3_9STRA|nr:unnamed protein product [Cylindrotheca closterium]
MTTTAIAVLVILLIQPVFGFVVPPPRPSSGGIHHSCSSSHRPTFTTTTTTPGTSSRLFALERAKEVFDKYSISNVISSKDLANMLNSLDVDASREEADALFRYLDTDGDGSITLEEFLPWYSETAEEASEISSTFQSLLLGRRTVHQFDQTPVSDDVLRRAIACAIAAPNRSQSEPWRFIQVGPETVRKFVSLKESMEAPQSESSNNWTKIPGWCVVTSKLSDDPVEELDDFKSTSCAVQNFMLSMWSEGIGTKWTSGPVQKTQEFADLCGVDTKVEKVAGCIWYGFATGGLKNADPKRRKKGVEDVLTTLP